MLVEFCEPLLSFEKPVGRLPSISREPSRSLMLRSPTAPWQTDETIPFCSQISREALKICITGEIPQHAVAADKVDWARIRICTQIDLLENQGVRFEGVDGPKPSH